MDLSLVIPAFNEEARLGVTLSLIADAWAKGTMGDIRLHEIIVVDDGSTDKTLDVAREWAGSLPVLTIELPINTGKGAALRAGVMQATGDAVLLYDADGATPIVEVKKLEAALRKDGSSISIGSRVSMDGNSLVTMQPHRRFIGRVYHALCAPLVPGLRDTACGCKLLRTKEAKELFSRQRINRFAYDVEILAMAMRMGYRISEVPVRWIAVPESKVRLIRDGAQMFLCLFQLYFDKLFRRLPGK